jgi:hypothetical protein
MKEDTQKYHEGTFMEELTHELEVVADGRF